MHEDQVQQVNLYDSREKKRPKLALMEQEVKQEPILTPSQQLEVQGVGRVPEKGYRMHSE